MMHFLLVSRTKDDCLGELGISQLEAAVLRFLWTIFCQFGFVKREFTHLFSTPVAVTEENTITKSNPPAFPFVETTQFFQISTLLHVRLGPNRSRRQNFLLAQEIQSCIAQVFHPQFHTIAIGSAKHVG